MARPLDELEARLAALDARLRPIADRPVDLSHPGALAALGARPNPLDESGTREPVEALVLEMVRDYAVAGPGWRAGARALLRRFRAFAWAARVPIDGRTPEGLRARLLLFSLLDQGPDPRDARLWLGELCDEARGNGLELGRLLREVAALSSDEDRHGWGSTRRWLEDAA